MSGRCIYINQRWSEITGLSIEDALGQGWLNAIYDDDRERVQAVWQRAVADQVAFKCEYRLSGAQGKIVWVISQALPEIGSDGKIKEYIGTLTDITELKQAFVAQQESAHRERAITQIIQRMRQTLDLEKIFAVTTQELRQVLNCDRVAVYRFNSDWSGKFIAESVGRGWISLLEDENNTNLEDTIKDERCIVQMLDSQDNQVPDTYLQETQGGRYSSGTSYLCVPDIYTAGFDECYINLLERFQAKAYIVVPIFCGSQNWGLLACYQNSGSRQWKTVEVNIVVQIGNQLGVALHQAELLAQTQKQSQALQQAAIAADAANRAKSEFLANMSHELRNPLNAILGFTQLMSRKNSLLSTKHQQYLEIINSSGEHLLNLINDILEMSKIEAGRTTLNVKDFDLIQLLDNLYEMLQQRAAASGLQLIFEYAPDIPRYVQTDSSKLRQVLLNLLGNAIKFTERGSVTLRIKVVDGSRLTVNSQQLTLLFEVTDTGTGIAKSEINLLFEAFGQTESGRNSQQGTGLGLAISRKYVQMMGGEISVSSTLGQGSTFSFDVLIRLAENSDIQNTQRLRRVIGLAPEQNQTQALPLEYRILVVDDNEDSRLLLSQLLTSIGFAVQVVTNGREAISLWSSWQPHLILMDMRMPVMDGYEATRQIRAQEAEKATRIIALTASAFEEQKMVMIEAGCDDFIRKPFQQEILLEKLSQYLGVKYVYEEESNQSKDEKQKITHLLSLLSQMSPEWIAEVNLAAAQGSDDLILNLVEQIPKENAALANFFSDLAENFQFEKIREFTEERDESPWLQTWG